MKIGIVTITFTLVALTLARKAIALEDYDNYDETEGDADYFDYYEDPDVEKPDTLDDNITKPANNDKCENMQIEECPFKISQKLSLKEKGLLASKDGCKIREQIKNERFESKTTDDLIITANEKYCFLVYIEADTLGEILRRNDVVRGLNDETINFMIHSPMLAQTFEKLPDVTIAKMINANPKIAALLPTNEEFPAKNLMTKLMLNERYIRTLRVEILAYLAETQFRTLLSEEVIHLILKIHPTLTEHLSKKGKDIIPKFIHKQNFLERLQCSVIQNIVSDVKFINGLSSRDIKKLLRTQKIWNCLSVEQIRKIVKSTPLANKANLSDIYHATKLVPLDKRLDRSVIWNMIRYQLPRLVKNELATIIWRK